MFSTQQYPVYKKIFKTFQIHCEHNVLISDAPKKSEFIDKAAKCYYFKNFSRRVSIQLIHALKDWTTVYLSAISLGRYAALSR